MPYFSSLTSMDDALDLGAVVSEQDPRVEWHESKIAPGKWVLRCQNTATGETFTLSSPAQWPAIRRRLSLDRESSRTPDS